MPEILPEEADSSESECMFVGAVADASEIGEMLHPVLYETPTRAELHVGEGLPVANDGPTNRRRAALSQL